MIIAVELALIYFFAYFWTTVQFQPKEMANQLRDYGSFIPGLRPGKRTADYLEKVEVPIIGIGAGPATDGQVLVFHDLLGIHEGHTPRFVRRYAEVHKAMVQGVRAYADDVRSKAFPDEEHSYSISPEELAEFKRYLDEESLAGTNTPWDW